MWSLGVVLYEMCMLERPFEDPENNRYRLQEKIFSGKYKPTSILHCPAPINSIITSLIVLDAKKRLTTLDLLRLPFIQEQAQNSGLLTLFPKDALTPVAVKANSETSSTSLTRLNLTPSSTPNTTSSSLSSNEEPEDVREFITEITACHPSITRADFCKEFEEVFGTKATPKQVNLFMRTQRMAKK